MENATKTRPARAKKVLTEKDFPGKTNKQLEAEERAELRKIGRETGAKPYAQIKAEQEAAKKGGAKLATGLTGRNAPHSSKAVGDSARATKAAAKTAKVLGTPKVKAERKAAAKAATSRSADHGAKLTVLVKAKDSGLRPESGRYAKLAAAEKAKTVGDWLGKTVTDATGAQHKCDRGALGGMIKRGHVKIG